MRGETRRLGGELGRGFFAFAVAIALIIGLSLATRRLASMRIASLITAAMIAIDYLVASRWIERKPAPELKKEGRAKEFGAGLALGIALFSSVMAILWAIGVYHFSGWGKLVELWDGVIFALTAAVMEEIIFRGYLFRLLSIATGTWMAVALTSALFGAAHAANPNATLFSAFAIALEAGVILAGAFALTGRLWMPIGLHFGWNFAESTIWGMSVSGGAIKPGLTRGNLSGAPILTGGGFGPEASIIAVVLCFGVGALLLWRASQLGKIQPPMWTVRPTPARARVNFR